MPDMPGQASFPIVVGSTVKYLGADAVVISIDHPGNHRSPVSLVYHDASDGQRQRIANHIAYGAGRGCWITQAELDASRPLTPLQELEKARADGKRVPEVGLVVHFGRNEGTHYNTCQVMKRRLRITTVHSLTEIDGLILEHRSDDDAEAPDVPLANHAQVRNAKHASLASDWSKEEHYLDHWCYVDENFIVDSEPTPFNVVHPPHICQACKIRVTHVVAIDLGDVENGAPKPLLACLDCRTACRELLGLSPTPATAPTPSFAYGLASKPVEPTEADLESMAEAEEVARQLEARSRARLSAFVEA